MIASVIIDVKINQEDPCFDYIIPKHLIAKIKTGMRVLVSFNTQKRLAYVVDIKEHSEFANKEILYLFDSKPMITKNQFELIKHIEHHSFTTYPNAFKTVIPKTLQLKIEREHLVLKEEQLPVEFQTKVKNNILSLYDLDDENFLILDKLIKKNILKRQKIDLKETKIKFDLNENKIDLNNEQLNAFKQININKYSTYLIDGPPVSGKTEIILNVIDSVITKGKQVLVLVPEKSMIPQMASRIKKRFNQVSIYHGSLGPKSRYLSYLSTFNNPSNIIVGTRSALFLPFINLGAIILDEAHDMSYIQKQNTYYDAKEIATLMARSFNCPLIYLTATPTASLYYDANYGKIKHLKLSKSVYSNETNIKVIDMKKELLKGNLSILSETLKLEIKKRLKLSEQVILLVNKKGYAPFVLCRSCGYVKKCPNCELSLVYYKNDASLKCHYCGYQEPYTNKCPSCKGNQLVEVGVGIEQVEEVLKETFKDIRVLRLDQTTTTKKQDADKILTAFLKKEADILIGTEMVSKGHHFLNVSLVAVLLAEQMLNLSSYLANEKAYNLINQHIGRIRNKDGLAIIQTFNEDHFVIKSILNKDFSYYYKHELDIRRGLSLEPFYNVVKITFSGKDQFRIFNTLNRIKQNIIAKNSQITIIGPTENYIFHSKGNYFYSMMIKSPKLTPIDGLLHSILKRYYQTFNVDIDKYPESI